MLISKIDVENVANLAKLNLSESEIEDITEKMEHIIEFANKINSLNLDGVKPSNHPMDISNVYREDIVKESFDRDEILKNAPNHDGEYFKVTKVVDWYGIWKYDYKKSSWPSFEKRSFISWTN